MEVWTGVSQHIGFGLLAEDDDSLQMWIIGTYNIATTPPEFRLGDRLQLPPIRENSQFVKPPHQSMDLLRSGWFISSRCNYFQQEFVARPATRIRKLS